MNAVFYGIDLIEKLQIVQSLNELRGWVLNRRGSGCGSRGCGHNAAPPGNEAGGVPSKETDNQHGRDRQRVGRAPDPRRMFEDLLEPPEPTPVCFQLKTRV